MDKQFENRKVRTDLTVWYLGKTYDVRHLSVCVGDVIGVRVALGVVTFLVKGQEYDAK